MSSIISNIVSPTTKQPYSIVIGMMIQPQIKTQLQQLLGEVILKSVKTGETVIVTGAFENWKEVCSNYLLDAVIQLLECDHKEADTRILLHVIRSNASCFVIDCNDSDVLIALHANYEHMGDKDVYMRRSKNDILDIKKIAGGLRTLELNHWFWPVKLHLWYRETNCMKMALLITM